MECQREPAAPRRVRLTDQALVAVALARRSAAAHGREPTAVDLLLGLASEPDGWAGRVLRRRDTAVVTLAARAGSPPPAMPALLEVVAAAADRAAPRPPGTRDLMAAVHTVGGDDVDALLASCGYDARDLRSPNASDGLAPYARTENDERWTGPQETVTLAGPGLPALSRAAAHAVGRVRAAGGGALALLELLVDEDAGPKDGTIGEATILGALAARAHLERSDPAAAATAPRDAGLDPVLAVTADLTAGRAATTADLLHALLLAGGTGPLDALRRRLGDEPPGSQPPGSQPRDDEPPERTS